MRGRVGAAYLLTFIFIGVPFAAKSQITIENVPRSPERQFGVGDFEEIISLTEYYRGQTKITSLDPITFGEDAWDSGSWGRGFFSLYDSQRDFPDYLNGIIAADSLRYWGSHPLIRSTGRMVRAHVHARHLYPQIQNLQIIKDGLNNLLQEKQSDGSYPYYKYRADKSDFNAITSNGEGEEEYETSEGLRALAESYLYFKNKEIHFKNDSLYSAIAQSGKWLASAHNYWQTWNKNSNIPGFALWALADAFKVKNDTSYLFAISNICKLLIRRQEKSGINSGLWLTGSIDVVKNGSVIHDTKIWYHAIILRGLVDALAVIPDKNTELRAQVGDAIKLGINHIINDRLRTELPSLRSYPIPESEYSIGGEEFFEMLSLLAYESCFQPEFSSEDRTNLLNLLNNVSINLDKNIPNFNYIQNFNSIAYYSDYLNAIKTKTKILHWIDEADNREQFRIHETIVGGDFDGDSKHDNVAAFRDAPNEGASLEVWKINGTSMSYVKKKTWTGHQLYKVDSIRGRIFAGDFDADGMEDDIVAFYVTGDSTFQIHRWTSNEGSLNFSKIFKNVSPYAVAPITGKMVCGDFDQDGYNDDLAAFYPNGKDHTEIDVWLYDNILQTFLFDGKTGGWWSSHSYSPDRINARVVCGDFDHDGFTDDLAAFYDVTQPGGWKSTRIDVWLSDGRTFSRQEGDAWLQIGTENISYNAGLITSRIACGDFNNDGFRDDIAAYFPSADGTPDVDIWTGDGNSNFRFCSSLSRFSNTAADATLFNADDNSIQKVIGGLEGNGYSNLLISVHDYPLHLSRFNGWKLRAADSVEFQGGFNQPVEAQCAIGMHERERGDDARDDEVNLSRTNDSNILSIYPNPNRGRFTIETGEVGTSVQILNFFGEIVYQDQMESGNALTLDLAGTPPGVYLLKVRTKLTFKAVKIFIQ